MTQISGIQLLTFQTPACCSCRRLWPEFSTLNSTLYTGHTGWDPQTLQFDSIPLNSLLACHCTRVHSHASSGSLPNLRSCLCSPFKRVSVWPPYCITKPWGMVYSTHIPSPHKLQNLSLSGLSTVCQNL